MTAPDPVGAAPTIPLVDPWIVLHLLVGIGLILFSWLALIACIVGVGLLPARPLGLEELDRDALFQAFWFGLGLVTLTLHVWHFAFPIAWPLLGIVLLAGGVGLYGSRGELRQLAGRLSIRRPWPALAVTLLLGAWLANESSAACCSFDTAANHLLVVRWSEAYPVVPGLGNLYGQLAFNNSNLLYSALLDTGPWAGHGTHIANGLLLFVFLAGAVPAGFSLATRSLLARRDGSWSGEDSRERRTVDRDTAVSVFRLVLVAPAILFTLTPQIASFNTNLAGTIVGLAAAIEVYRYLLGRVGPRQGAFPVVATGLILATAVSFKLNVGAFAGLALVVIAVTAWTRLGRPLRRRAAAWSLALCGALGITWVARGVVLSGYPVFPSTALAVPVPWQVPEQAARGLQEWVRHSGRVAFGGNPELGQYGWSLDGRWVRPWLERTFFTPGDLFHANPNPTWSIALPAVIGVLAALLYVLIRRVGVPLAERRAWWLLVPTVVGIGVWFWAAPQPRLGLALLWTFAALCAAQLAGAVLSRHGRPRRVALLLLLGLALAPLWTPLTALSFSGRRSVAAAFEEALFVRPPAKGLWHPMPPPRIHSYQTSSGLVLWVPDGNDVRCWDAPLPCTPNPAPNLRLRDSSSLGAGFVTVGPWRAERWPNPQVSFKESWLRHARP